MVDGGGAKTSRVQICIISEASVAAHRSTRSPPPWPAVQRAGEVGRGINAKDVNG